MRWPSCLRRSKTQSRLLCWTSLPPSKSGASCLTIARFPRQDGRRSSCRGSRRKGKATLASRALAHYRGFRSLPGTAQAGPRQSRFGVCAMVCESWASLPSVQEGACDTANLLGAHRSRISSSWRAERRLRRLVLDRFACKLRDAASCFVVADHCGNRIGPHQWQFCHVRAAPV